jgi:hypothetical protein
LTKFRFFANVYTHTVTQMVAHVELENPEEPSVNQITSEPLLSARTMMLNYVADFIITDKAQLPPHDSDWPVIKLEITRLIYGHTDRVIDLDEIRTRVQQNCPETRVDFHFDHHATTPWHKFLGFKVYRNGYMEFFQLHTNGNMRLVSSKIPIPRS